MESCLWSHVFRVRTFSSFAGAWLNKLKIFICKVFPRTLLQVLLLLCFLSFSFFSGFASPTSGEVMSLAKAFISSAKAFRGRGTGGNARKQTENFLGKQSWKKLIQKLWAWGKQSAWASEFSFDFFFFVWLRRWDGLMAHRTMEMLFYWELDNKKWLNLEKGKKDTERNNAKFDEWAVKTRSKIYT